MGACCSKGINSESLGVKGPKVWGKTFAKKLASSLHSSENSKWFSEVMQISANWQSSPNASRAFQIRWSDYSTLENTSPYLTYDPECNCDSKREMKNLFFAIGEDFEDQRTPIGAIIHAFLECYFAEFGEFGATVVAQKDQEAAATHLLNLSTLLYKLTQVLSSTSIVLYEKVAMKLSSKRSDLDGLILAHLVSKQMYRLLEDLALVVKQDVVEALAGVSGTEYEDFGLKRDDFTSFTCQLGDEVHELLQQFADTENFYARRKILFRVSETLAKASDCEEKREDLALWVVAKHGLKMLPVHLYMTKKMIVDEPDSMELLLKAMERLTNKPSNALS